jgi:hypothetical protein
MAMRVYLGLLQPHGSQMSNYVPIRENDRDGNRADRNSKIIKTAIAPTLHNVLGTYVNKNKQRQNRDMSAKESNQRSMSFKY